MGSSCRRGRFGAVRNVCELVRYVHNFLFFLTTTSSEQLGGGAAGKAAVEGRSTQHHEVRATVMILVAEGGVLVEDVNLVKSAA